MHERKVVFRHCDSPVGRLLLVGDGQVLRGLYFPDHLRGPHLGAHWQSDTKAFDAAVAQLAEYFAGVLTRFDVPLALEGTPFQHRVWQALGELEYGATTTYATLARQIGRPRAVRAVGAAVALNPVSILVPCHRVVGFDGRLTGYAGGIERKRWLLRHEQLYTDSRAAGSAPAGRLAPA